MRANIDRADKLSIKIENYPEICLNHDHVHCPAQSSGGPSSIAIN